MRNSLPVAPVQRFVGLRLAIIFDVPATRVPDLPRVFGWTTFPRVSEQTVRHALRPIATGVIHVLGSIPFDYVTVQRKRRLFAVAVGVALRHFARDTKHYV